MALRRYRKRPDALVVAIRLDLDTDGFSYRKWGGVQRCKRGDWVVQNVSDVYTVDSEVFERTYVAVGQGRYAKTMRVWAEIARSAGSIVTKEGISHYAAGDYIVSNNETGTDVYCVTAGKFEEMYVIDD